MKPVLSIGVLALVLVGCATPVKVAWVGLRDVQAGPVSSYILRNENLPEPEAAQLRAALGSRGFREASSGEAAELILSVDAGIGPPRATPWSWQMPSRSPVNYDLPSPLNPQSPTVWLPNDENTHLASTPIYSLVDARGVKQPFGISPGTDAVFVREQYLRIAAYSRSSATTKRPESEIWSVRVSVQEEWKDLRQNLPLLASAATDAIAKNTRNEVKRTP